MGNLINNIPSSHLDIKFTRLGFENACSIAWQASRCQQAFSKPCLVNLMRIYRCSFNFFLLFHMLTCLTIHHQTLYSYSITISFKQNQVLPYLCAKHSYSKRTIPGKEYKTNQEYTTFVLGNFYHMVFSLLMVHLLLLQSGDVHPNPGPSSVSSDTSDNMSRSSASSILDSINLSRHLSLFITMYRVLFQN